MNSGVTTVESLMVEWRAETSKYKQDMNEIKQSTKQTADEVKKTVTEAQNLTREATAVGGSMQTMGQQAVASATQMEGLTTTLTGVLGVLLAVKKAAQGTWQAIQLAMDVHESEELFDTSLGRMADSTRAWSEQVSDSLGTSADAIRRTTGLWYTMIESMGMGSDQALQMSKSLVQLKYDLMSFYNINDPEQAETIIRGLITGESASAKRIGVILTDEAAKRALVTAGIIQEGQEVNHTTMMYGRYLSMMEQTAVAQGDMARTIDSPANQLRVLQTELRELELAWGQAFLPIAQTVIPMLTSLANAIKPIISLIASLGNLVFGSRESKVLGGFSFSSVSTPTKQVTAATNEGAAAWSAYGDSAAGATGKAAAGVQALRRSILGFDQINKLVDPDSGAGGGGVLGPGGGSPTGITLPAIEFGDMFEIDDAAFQESSNAAMEKLKSWWMGFKEKWDNFKEEHPLLAGLAKFFTMLTPQGGFFTGLGLINFMKSPQIPEYNLVPDDISQKTQDKLDPLLDVWYNTQAQMKQWAWGNVEISSQMATDMTKNVTQMGRDIANLIDEDTQEQYDIMKQYFDDSSVLSEEREAEILQSIIDSGNNKKRETQGYARRISEIYQTAADEHRELTAEEEREVSALMIQMRDNSIEAAAESSDEQQKILNHLQQQSGIISARQAADIVKSSIKAKDEAIAAANERYDKEIAAAERLHEAGLITDDEYAAMVKAAEQARDDTIAAAEETHAKVVEEAKAQAGEHVNEVDWETGEVITNWEYFKIRIKQIWDDIAGWFKGIGQTFRDVWDDITGKGRKVNEDAIPSATQLAGPIGGAGLRPGNFNDLYYGSTSTSTNVPKSVDVSNRMTGYATGGSPEPGEIFRALEDGPEWIGTMGRRTVVANNKQIVEGISSGVFNAVSAAVAMNAVGGSKQPIAIYVGGNKLLDTVVEVSNRESARTGKRVIHVGV